MTQAKKYLTKKSDDISRWYNEIIEKADLAEHAPVKGCMIIKPYGYALWEKTQQTLDTWFKAEGVQNVYFPLFIPYSYLEKEKKHVEGFSPELALVTMAGGEKLKEPLVVRPTSETIIYQTFKNWIHSYKDLPLKINQWCSVVRWEKRTYLFLRTSEFLWQEGHTVHRDEKETMEMVMRVLQWYKNFFENYLAISVFAGEKSASERFAGATRTFSIELVIPNGKALQGATSHNLGQNFSKSFDISYTDEQNNLQHPYQTSWGISTRAIGGLILSQGDDHGLIIPPYIAPIQAVIFVIASRNTAIDTKIKSQVKKVAQSLEKAGFRVRIDQNDKSIGSRISESEIKGIPIRLEVGQNELKNNTIIVSRRDTRIKERVKLESVSSMVSNLVDTMQQELLIKSEQNKRQLTANVDNFEEFKKIMESNRKFIRSFWCESTICEQKIKEITKAETRVCELDELEKSHDGACIYCGNKARRKWLFAQAY